MTTNSQRKIFTFPKPSYQLGIQHIEMTTAMNWKELTIQMFFLIVLFLKHLHMHLLLLSFPSSWKRGKYHMKYLGFNCITCHSMLFTDTYLLLIFRSTFIFTVWPGSNFIAAQRWQKDYKLQITRGRVRFNRSTQLTHGKLKEE